MDEWIVLYKLEDGTQDEVIVSAACKVAAWDAFEEIIKEQGLTVVAADCCKLTSEYEKEDGDEKLE